MAKGNMNKVFWSPGPPKKTRQGRSARTLLSATSRNSAKKRYRGQGIEGTECLNRIRHSFFYVFGKGTIYS
jgi:hypothetical protein